MKWRRPRYALALIVALIVTIVVALVASVPGCSPVGIMLVPGMLAAAIILPQGPHSDWPTTYMLLAGLLNALLLSWPILGLWMLVERVRRKLPVRRESAG